METEPLVQTLKLSADDGRNRHGLMHLSWAQLQRLADDFDLARFHDPHPKPWGGFVKKKRPRLIETRRAPLDEGGKFRSLDGHGFRQ